MHSEHLLTIKLYSDIYQKDKTAVEIVTKIATVNRPIVVVMAAILKI